MAVSLPNGVILSLAATYAASIAVTAASNAAESVLTAANALAAGDIVEFASGWARANGRVFRVKAATGTTVTLEGFDTTSTALYPAGAGTGSIRKVLTWTQISQVLDLSTNGGDTQFATYSFLENDFESQIPSGISAQSVQFGVADDASLAGYQALKTASDARSVSALKMAFPSGSLILYNGYTSFNETPSLQKGNVMACKATFSLQSRPVRYAA